MTALQDWLSIRSVDPRCLPGRIRDVIRGLTDSSADEAAPHRAGSEPRRVPMPKEPALMGRGLERC